jgi:hypothetical protein
MFTPDQQQRWRARLATTNPVDALTRLIWACLAKDILPVFRLGEPHVDIPTVAAPLAHFLCDAVVDKLARTCPKHAARGTPTLIRTRPKQTLRLVGHACTWTMDRLREDLIAYPADALEARVNRTWAAGHIVLPNLRPGSQSWLGINYSLWVVEVHDLIQDDLRETFPGSQWRDTPFKQRREILHGLPGTKDDPPFSAEVLDTAARCDFRWEATRVLTAAVVDLAETSVPRVVGRTRPLARALADADRRAGRQ